MASNTYREIREDLRCIADILEDNDFEYKAYNEGIQFNVKDTDGIIHSFYPTSGTMLFHASNERSDRRIKTIRGGSIEEFMQMLRHTKRIKNLFTEGD